MALLVPYDSLLRISPLLRISLLKKYFNLTNIFYLENALLCLHLIEPNTMPMLLRQVLTHLVAIFFLQHCNWRHVLN